MKWKVGTLTLKQTSRTERQLDLFECDGCGSLSLSGGKCAICLRLSEKIDVGW